MTYFTYILHSEKHGGYYVGSTQNIEERIKRHNAGKEHFTSMGFPWQLVYWEQFETRLEAYNKGDGNKGTKE